MRDRLLHYYERELHFIRRLASQFGEKYPDVAGALMLESTKCDDPHIERLIESFAVMAARVHMRLDDDFSEVSEALLGMLYPHYLAPVPSMAIAQFSVDRETGGVAGGVKLPRGSTLLCDPVKGTRCRFRTAYPLALWPLEVVRVEVVPSNVLRAGLPPEVRSAVRIELRAPQATDFRELAIDSLRFFLPAEAGSVSPLYELLLKEPRGLLAQTASGRSLLLGPESVRPVGFGRDEGLLEYPEASFAGYRLLQEYFAFPEKFQFVELGDLDRIPFGDDDRELALSVLLGDSLSESAMRLGPEDLLLGCTPIVNLFAKTAEPIRVTHEVSEDEVKPSVRNPGSYEVYSIERVSALRRGTALVREFVPFYAIRHGRHGREKNVAYWYASRRQPVRAGPTSAVYLTLVDPEMNLFAPDVDTLTVDTLCTNAALPSQLEYGRPEGDFAVDGPSPVARGRCVRNPTPPIPAPVGSASRWRLISHLALNHLSLSGDDASGERGRGLDALRKLLELYDFADSPTTRARIDALVAVRAKRVVRRVGRGGLSGFVYGTEVGLELDRSGFTGSGAFLFASVLERFLGLYASVNSFSQTVVTVRGREGVFKRWPPRAGERPVL